MNNKTLKQVQEIAKGLSIALSYKAENGIRKRYTKSELIKLVIDKEVELMMIDHEINVSNFKASIEEEKSSKSENKLFVSTEMDIPADLKQLEVKIENSSTYGEFGKSKYKKAVELQLNTVVAESRKLISHGKIEKVKLFIDELTNRIKNECHNKLLVADMSAKLNILKSLIKQYTSSNKSNLSF